ncbi:MAG: hypothetical protein GY866_41505, partial [Proteobacteria bacterium]|nr:hypothetical protein [Pseudomonadota bacterium]
NRSFDIVFDTTGTPEGFAAALDLTRRVLHLKSTNGLEVMGLRHLTDMVVDEIALLPYDLEGMNFTWPIEARKRKNPNIFVSPGVSKEDLEQMRSDYPDRRFFHSTIPETVRRIENTPNLLEKSPLPQFDLAIVKDPDDIDRVLRPVPGETFSLVRPRGAILLLEGKSQKTENQLFQAVTKGGIQIHTSRCGNFERALKIMQENTDLQRTIENHYLTHRLPLNRISKAFETATDSRRCIKAVVEMP